MSSWPVVDVVKTRAAAEVVGVPMGSTMGVPASSAKVPEDPAVEATSMDPLWWGTSSWLPGSRVVNVVEIVETRAAAEAVGVPTALTMGVPSLSAKVLEDPVLEATLMDPLWWGPSSGLPGSPVVNVVKIVAARAAAGVARPKFSFN